MGGASRFDGLHFDNHSLESVAGSEVVVGFFSNPSLPLAAVTPTGIAILEDRQFKAASFNDRFFQTTIKGVKRANDTVWILTRDGLFFIDDSSGYQLDEIGALSGRDINAVQTDKKGITWVATRGDGLSMRQTSGLWKHFTTNEGLPSPLVNDVFESSDGTIWVATHQGVAYFDGNIFRLPPFSAELPTPIIYGFTEDEANRLWIKTSLAGVLVWDGVRAEHFDARKGLPGNINVELFNDQKGHLWASSNQGLARYEQRRFTNYREAEGLSSNLVTCLFEDREFGIWIGTAAGLNRIDGNRFSTWMTETSKAITPHLSRIYQIFRDSKRRLWFPTYSGLGMYDGQTFHHFTQNDGLPHQEIHSIIEDRSGTIWVASANGAARLVDYRFQPLTDVHLHEKPIGQMLSDQSGTLWFLRGDLKVFSIAPGVLNAVAASFIPDEAAVSQLFKDDDGYPWFRGRDRFIFVGPEGPEQILFEEIDPDLQVYDELPATNGTLWLGTNKGLVAYGRHESNIINSQGLDQFHVSKISRTPHGELWLSLATPKSPGSDRHTPYGVARYDGISVEIFPDIAVTSRGVSQFKHFSDGSTWIMHGKGVSQYKNGVFTHTSIEQGLAGNSPSTVVKDRNGNHWIATRGGLSKMQSGLITNYDQRDGLLVGDVTDLDFDDQGDMWIRTRRGVQRYRENNSRPRVEIGSVHVGEREIGASDQPTLSHNENNLTINYRAISLSPGADKIQFRYKISGNEHGWIGPTSETKVHLSQLRPGNYLFVVEAFSRDLYVCDEPATFAFEVLQPIWLTPWFMASMTIALFAVGFALYRHRLVVRLEQDRVVNELNVATEMQMGLMPTAPPHSDVFDIWGVCQPAREVGGDYFDYFELGKDDIGIAVVDVSGKSMEAAIIAVLTSGLLHGEINQEASPGRILSRMNTPMYAKTRRNVFNAALFARLAVNAGHPELTLANAGQLRPLLLRDGLVNDLRVDGIHLPLGVLNTVDYPQDSFPLKASDLLIFFTDGVNEAMNPSLQLFGLERLKSLVESCSAMTAKQAVENIINALTQFGEEMPPNDDITVVAVKVS